MCKYQKSTLIFMILLIFIIFPASVFASEFDSGDGSENSPYVISEASQLYMIGNYPSCYFTLKNDIIFTEEDFSEGGEFYNDGSLWLPIGDKENPFTGSFDGCGHEISGLKIHASVQEDAYIGLFGYVSGGKISNVSITDSDIIVTGGSDSGLVRIFAAAVAGVLDGGIIENCGNIANVMVYSDMSLNYAGGISACIKNGSEIRNCFNSGNITAVSEDNVSVVGGIAADVTDSRIVNCYNCGEINSSAKSSAYSFAGGIAGEVAESIFGEASVEYCISVGNVMSDVSALSDGSDPGDKAAAIASANISGSILGCYHTVGMKSVGQNKDGELSDIVSLSEEQMTLQESFANLDLENTWTIVEGGKFPTLKSVVHSEIGITGISLREDARTEYAEGEEIDLDGTYLIVNHSDGENTEVPLSEATVYGYDGNTVGTHSITVLYKGFSVRFEITVSHVYTPEITEATCTEGGYTTYTCDICGDNYTSDETEALGHTEITDVEYLDPTCTEDGHTKGTVCEVCGDTVTESEVIPKLGHDFEPVYDGEMSYDNHCIVCGHTEALSGEETVEVINNKLSEAMSDGIDYEDIPVWKEISSVYHTIGADDIENVDNEAYETLRCRIDHYYDGDLDFDGIIRSADISIALYNYGNSGGYCDLNGDGRVNSDDLSTVLFGYGTRAEK